MSCRLLWMEKKKPEQIRSNSFIATNVHVFTKFWQGNFRGVRETMFRIIVINFSQKSPHFSLLSSTYPFDLPERKVTSPSNLKVLKALDFMCQDNLITISCYITLHSPPNIWQNPIRGRVQMNSWSTNENTTSKILAVPFTSFNYCITNGKLIFLSTCTGKYSYTKVHLP